MGDPTDDSGGAPTDPSQLNPFAGMGTTGGDSAGGAPPPQIDPYAGLAWPPPSWGLSSPPPTTAAVPFDTAQGIAPTPPEPPTQASVPMFAPVAPPGSAPFAPQAAPSPPGSPPPPTSEDSEPSLPGGTLTRDRAPADTTGSAPINVSEALGDPQRGVPASSTEESDHDRLRQQYLADPLNPEAAKYLSPEQRGAALEAMSPQQFAAYTIRRQDEKGAQDQAEQAQLARENATKADREWQLHQDARAATTAQQAKLNADIAAALKEKNPSWLESRSTFQKIAGALSAIVGGLSQGAGSGYHGPNVGLEMMEKAANEYEQHQRGEQEQKRALLGQEQSSLSQRIQAESEDFHERTVHRVAMFESAKQALLSEQQKYDPQGTTSLQIGSAVRQIDAQQAAAQQVYAEKQFKNNLDIVKTQQEAQKIQETATQNRAGNQLRGYEISTTRRGQDLTEQQHKEQVQLERDKIAAADKDKADKLKQESGFGVFPITVTDASGKPTGVAYKPAVNADGKEWIPQGKPEDIAKLREKSVAVTDLTQIMDKVQRLRTGWSNSLKDREELQRIQAEWALGKVAFKNYAQLGALSESDYELVDKGLGTSDPTKFFDQSAGIKEARNALVRSLNNSMRSHGYDNPKDFQLPDTSELNVPSKDAIDLLGESINAQPASQHDAKAVASAMKAPEGLDQLYKIASGEGLNGKDPGTTLLREFYADPEKRAKALQYLKDAAENAPLDKIKDQAKSMYDRVVGPQNAPGTGTDPNPPNRAGVPISEGG